MTTQRNLTNPGPTLVDEHEHGRDPDVVWVHLCSGRLVEIRPATDVKVTDTEVIVLDGERVAATFGRHQVYFTCRGGDTSPVVG